MTPADLDTYVARLGLNAVPSATMEGVASLQRRHRLVIPFENIDVLLGRGISLDPDAVFDKLVRQRRGGYCFEHNQLLLRVLQAMGIDARPLLARVWIVPTDGVPPRTHTLNLVTMDGYDWIVDAGFGAAYAPPLPLIADSVTTGPDGAQHRLIRNADHGWMQERDGGDGFRPQFSFTTDPVEPADLALSNHWTATAPASRFTRHLITSIALPRGMASLMDRAYTRHIGDETSRSEITSERMLQMRLSLMFGIDLSLDEIAALALFDNQDAKT